MVHDSYMFVHKFFICQYHTIISMHKLKCCSRLLFFIYSLNELIVTAWNPSLYPNKSISLSWVISPSGKRLWNYSLLKGLPFPSSPLTKTIAYNFTLNNWSSLTIVYPSNMMKCKYYATTSILPIITTIKRSTKLTWETY